MRKILFFAISVIFSSSIISIANAEDSRPCAIYPASVTPECVAENLAYEAQRQLAYQAEQKAKEEAVLKAAAEQAQKDYVANGSRPCSIYPASITPTCVAENLLYEQQRQAAYSEEQKAKELEALKAAELQAQKDYVANGSRPCSLYPASITPACAAENLKFEDNRKIVNELTSKLKAISTTSSATKLTLPASNLITEKYQVSTPKVCKVVGNTIIKIKNGICDIKVSYVTDQAIAVDSSKKIVFKK